MKLLRSRFIRIVVLAAFFGVHTAQTFHTHRVGAPDNQCSVCQVIHHTPGADVSSQSALNTVFTYQSLLAVGGCFVIADRSSNSALPRAPPAA